VIFACTKLKGQDVIWWNHVQKDGAKKGEDKIRTWSKMEKKNREICLPPDYAHTLFRRFQNLNQNMSTVDELTNEFYQLSIRVDH
jgi:hypothetical protein